MTSSQATTSHPGKTLLDRSIPIILPSSSSLSSTPSQQDGVSVDLERLHRLHGTSLIADACQLLMGNRSTVYPNGSDGSAESSSFASCYATACTLLHRFYHRVSLTSINVWSVAAAATLLAAKLEEIPNMSIYRIVLIYAHIYRRRRVLGHSEWQRPNHHEGTTSTLRDRHEVLKRLTEASALSPLGPVYKDWYDTIVETENQILRQLGFTLYWIAEQHPHKYLVPYLESLNHVQQQQHDDQAVVEMNQDGTSPLSMIQTKIAQTAWSYCNDSFRLDLCTHFASSYIAAAALYLAVMDHNVMVTTDANAAQHYLLPWYLSLCCFDLEPTTVGLSEKEKTRRTVTAKKDLAIICNALLAVSDPENQDCRRACSDIIPSLERNGSFNDPDSFLWEKLTHDIKAITGDV